MSKQNIPNPKVFFISIPLYEKFKFDQSNESQILEIFNFSDTFDSYCPMCNTHSIFSRKAPYSKHYMIDSYKNYLEMRIFQCSRDNHHILKFIIESDDTYFQKIGQSPSLATLNMYDVRKYSKILEKKYFQELTKAIGLVSHGIGVGSFVYLRRIFEFLINDSYMEAKIKTNWDDELYNKSRMAEKIDLLKDELPDFLVENKSMYGILSKGIHELSEEECLNSFQIVKLGIELILDEKIEKINRQKKMEEAKKALNILSGKIK